MCTLQTFIRIYRTLPPCRNFPLFPLPICSFNLITIGNTALMVFYPRLDFPVLTFYTNGILVSLHHKYKISFAWNNVVDKYSCFRVVGILRPFLANVNRAAIDVRAQGLFLTSFSMKCKFVKVEFLSCRVDIS